MAVICKEREQRRNGSQDEYMEVTEGSVVCMDTHQSIFFIVHLISDATQVFRILRRDV